MIRAAIYARVSTADQHTENQVQELRRYCEARGWAVVAECVDHGVSGAAQSRPALDTMLRDAKRRKFDAVVVWSLDRPGQEPEAPDHAAGRLSGSRHQLHFVARGSGLDDASRTPSGATTGHDLRVRAGTDRGTGACRHGAGEGVRNARTTARRGIRDRCRPDGRRTPVGSSGGSAVGRVEVPGREPPQGVQQGRVDARQNGPRFGPFQGCVPRVSTEYLVDALAVEC